MDYARKIGKSVEPKKWKRERTPCVTVRDKPISEDEPISPDRRLVNWEEWLANRRGQTQRIKSRTGRDQSEQLINSSDKIRRLIEMRNLMDFATTPAPVVPDKFRGGPEFWRTPKTLSRSGESTTAGITMVPSKKELNVTPELLYVDLPDVTIKEKDLHGLKCKEQFWRRSRYLKDRKTELAREIRLLVLKEPEMERLAVEGFRPQEKSKDWRIPPITITSPEEEPIQSELNPDQTVVLRIQDREIVWYKQLSASQSEGAESLTWSVTFGGKVGKREEKEIVFENKGNRVIVCQWRERPFQCKSMQFQRRVSAFYFNKTKSLLLPGETAKLKIWHLPRSPGVSSEVWELLTNPQLRLSPLTFRLWGCAVATEAAAHDLESIDRYLDRCIRDSLVREILRNILEDIYEDKSVDPPYKTLFLESEIFTSKNPSCFYHPSVVAEFHGIYYSASPSYTSPWSLSLHELRERLVEIEQPQRRNDALILFNSLYKKCLRPALRRQVMDDKYEMVYCTLCCFVNRLQDEAEYTMNACSLKKKRNVEELDETKSPNASKISIRSNIAHGKHSKTLGSRGQSSGTYRNIMSDEDYFVYGEMLFTRLHEIFRDTIGRICAVIHSFNRLNYTSITS